MNLKQKMNLSWVYDQYMSDAITEREMHDILRDFGYTIKQRIALMENMRYKKEEQNLDMWEHLLEKEAEEEYWSQ